MPSNTAYSIAVVVAIISVDHWSVFFAGTIYCNARPVHEEWTGLSSSLLHHCTVDLQRPSGFARSDPTCQRCWWCMSSQYIVYDPTGCPL